MFSRLPFTNFVALGHSIELVESSEIWMEKKKKNKMYNNHASYAIIHLMW